MKPYVSIVMSTFNKANLLKNTLDSIFEQYAPFPYEVIVVDDGSTDHTERVCKNYNILYHKTDSQTYRNPSVARNIGYKMAKGEVIICQSDEVIHKNGNVIYQLGKKIHEGVFIIGTVFDVVGSNVISQYTGQQNKRPLFFLGSVRREDLYKVGGNDEEFSSPGFEDNWFADCLIHGLGLKAVYDGDIVGWHQSHPRPNNISELVKPSEDLYIKKKEACEFKASGGSWVY